MKNSERTLTAKQLLAVEALAEGLSVKAAAERAGVARQRVSFWVHHDDDFQHALELRVGEMFAVTVSRLRNLSVQAVGILERGISGDELSLGQIKAAEAALRLCGVHRARLPLDPLDLSDLERGRAMRGAFDSIGRMLEKESEASNGVDEAQG